MVSVLAPSVSLLQVGTVTKIAYVTHKSSAGRDVLCLGVLLLALLQTCGRENPPTDGLWQTDT